WTAVLSRAADLPAARTLRAGRPGLRRARRAGCMAGAGSDRAAVGAAARLRPRRSRTDRTPATTCRRRHRRGHRLRPGLALAAGAGTDHRRLRLNPGEPVMTILNVNQAIAEALAEEMERDADVVLLGEGVATKHGELVAAFGTQRVRNTPLAEAIIAGTAVGAAASGLRPVVDMLFAPFLTYAMDALVNSAGKLRYLSGGQFEFPLVAMALTGAGWGVGGQHNHNLEAMFAHAPGLKVVMPSTPADFKGLLK